MVLPYFKLGRCKHHCYYNIKRAIIVNIVSQLANPHAFNWFRLTAAFSSSKRSRSPQREPPLDINVARGKPAKQSSSANLYMCEASKAVDGMLISDKKKNSCSLTKSQLGAWWEVDLGAVYEIHAVVITSPNSGESIHETSEIHARVCNHYEICTKLIPGKIISTFL